MCGKKIQIKINIKGHYNNGNYFGKSIIPIKETGHYKTIGTKKLFGRKINIVKWTGKEKEIEYWECNKCYST